MSKSAFQITDDTKNVLFLPTSKRVHADDKNAPPLKRRTPKLPKARLKRVKISDKMQS